MWIHILISLVGIHKLQLDDLLNSQKLGLLENTNLLLGPETVLQEMIWENKIDNAQSIIKLKKLLYEFPKLNILLGSTTFKYLGNKKETNSRKLKDNTWYNVYNSAILLKADSSISIYHKTKLVPGVEQIPYSFIFDKITDFTVDLGELEVYLLIMIKTCFNVMN